MSRVVGDSTRVISRPMVVGDSISGSRGLRVRVDTERVSCRVRVLDVGVVG